MQEKNTGPLCKYMGEVGGQEGWADLPNYFSHLDAYYYYAYEDKVISSREQKGGIEGWFNPIWTLMTLMAMERVKYWEGLRVIDTLAYSNGKPNSGTVTGSGENRDPAGERKKIKKRKRKKIS